MDSQNIQRLYFLSFLLVSTQNLNDISERDKTTFSLQPKCIYLAPWGKVNFTSDCSLFLSAVLEKPELKTVGHQLLWKTVWWFLKKSNTELPHDPAIPLLHKYLKNLKQGPSCALNH